MELTLGAFIQREIKRLGISDTEFAKLVGCSHVTISKYSNYGIKKTYSGKKIGMPPLDFLYKLAKATNYSLATIVYLIYPEASPTDPRRDILLDQINSLTPDAQEQAVIFILGLLAKRVEESGKRDEFTSGEDG